MGCAAAVLPAFVLAGLGLGLACGPLIVAATNGISPEQQGLAGGFVNTLFQVGVALAVAVVTALRKRTTAAVCSEAA